MTVMVMMENDEDDKSNGENDRVTVDGRRSTENDDSDRLVVMVIEKDDIVLLINE